MTRKPELAGQTVVVIGGSAGLGLETARRARDEGAEVILTGRNAEHLKQASADVGAREVAAFRRRPGCAPRTAQRQPAHRARGRAGRHRPAGRALDDQHGRHRGHLRHRRRGTARAGPAATDWYWQWLDSTVVPNISRLAAEFRGRDDLVLFTEFGSRTADGSDLPRWARRHDELALSAIGERIYLPFSDPAARVIAELAPVAGDVVVQKTTSGPLAGTDIAARLAAADIETVVVAGVVTDVCVTGMARELADSDFDVLVVADACGAPARESHEWALRVAIPTFASTVSTNDVLAMARDAAASPAAEA